MDIKIYQNKLKEIEEWLSKEYTTLRTGTASVSLLDSIMVNNYGTKAPLKNLASISLEGKRSLVVSPWDHSIVAEIESAINVANLGVSTSVADTSVRVNFPELTSEVREAIIKQAKNKLEESRISAKNEREKFIQELKQKLKNKEMSENEKFATEEKIDKLTKEVNTNLQNIYNNKEKELMG